MTTSARYDLDDGYAAGLYEDPKAAGWITFATVMLAFAGTFNFIDGLVALTRSKFFVADATYVFSDLRTWGWIVLLVGVAEGCAALALTRGSQLARWFAITVASVNALAQLMYIQAYPFWALAIFASDILIIYALAVYGGRTVRVE